MGSNPILSANLDHDEQYCITSQNTKNMVYLSMIFEADTAYTVDPETRSLDCRQGFLTSVDGELTKEQLETAFLVEGVESHDIVVFGHALNEDGVSSHGFLVVESSDGQGLVATDEYVAANQSYQTIELARKIATLDRCEVSQLGIDGLAAVLNKKFPDVRRLS